MLALIASARKRLIFANTVLTIPSGKQEALNIAKGGQAFSPFAAG